MNSASSSNRLRDLIASSRDPAQPTTDEQRNMAFIAKSATENILALQRAAHEQETQLEERRKEIGVLQRNYETLSRIRQGDAQEIAMLRSQKQQEADEVAALREQLRTERDSKAQLEARLAEHDAALAQVAKLKLHVEAADRKQAQALATAQATQLQAADLKEANRTLRLGGERLARAHTDATEKLYGTSKAKAQLEQDKIALQRELGAAKDKAAQLEKQLRTFLDFNHALEDDLRAALQRAAELGRRVKEVEFEKQTVEAYYTAKAAEMQAQLELLIGATPAAAAGADHASMTHAIDKGLSKRSTPGPAPASPASVTSQRPSMHRASPLRNEQ